MCQLLILFSPISNSTLIMWISTYIMKITSLKLNFSLMLFCLLELELTPFHEFIFKDKMDKYNLFVSCFGEKTVYKYSEMIKWLTFLRLLILYILVCLNFIADFSLCIILIFSSKLFFYLYLEIAYCGLWCSYVVK